MEYVIFGLSRLAHRAVDRVTQGANEVARALGAPTALDQTIDTLRQAHLADTVEAERQLAPQFRANFEQFASQVRDCTTWNTLWGSLLLFSSMAIAPKRLIGGAVLGTFMLQFSNTYTGKIQAWGDTQRESLPYLAVMGFALMLTKAKGVHPLMQPLFQPLATGVAVATGYMAAHRIANRTLL